MRLNQNNFLLYAAKYYDNPQCLSEEEFLRDIAILTDLKRYMKRYTNGQNICIKMITNTLITFYNVFERNAATALIKFKFEPSELEYINSFLVFLSLPKVCNKYNKELYIQLTELYK